MAFSRTSTPYHGYRYLTHPSYQDLIKTHNHATLDLVAQIAKFVQQIASAHQEFANRLWKNVNIFKEQSQQFEKYRITGYDKQCNSIYALWDLLIQETHLDAQAHSETASLLSSEVAVRLEDIIKYKNIQAEMLFSFRENTERALIGMQEDVLQQQKSYTESVELMYSSNRPSSTGGTDVSSKCQMTPYNCTKHNDCVLLIRAANNQEQQYHQTVLPSLLEDLEEIFIDLANTLTGSLEGFAILLITKAKEQTRRYEEVQRVCRQKDAKADIDGFVTNAISRDKLLPYTARHYSFKIPPSVASSSSLNKQLVIDGYTVAELEAKRFNLQKAASDLTVTLKQSDDMIQNLITSCERSLAESNYTKSYELQNDLCQKRIDAHKGMLRLSLVAAQIDLLSQKENCTTVLPMPINSGKQSKITIRGMWKQAFKSLKRGNEDTTPVKEKPSKPLSGREQMLLEKYCKVFLDQSSRSRSRQKNANVFDASFITAVLSKGGMADHFPNAAKSAPAAPYLESSAVDRSNQNNDGAKKLKKFKDVTEMLMKGARPENNVSAKITDVAKRRSAFMSQKSSSCSYPSPTQMLDETKPSSDNVTDSTGVYSEGSATKKKWLKQRNASRSFDCYWHDTGMWSPVDDSCKGDGPAAQNYGKPIDPKLIPYLLPHLGNQSSDGTIDLKTDSDESTVSKQDGGTQGRVEEKDRRMSLTSEQMTTTLHIHQKKICSDSFHDSNVKINSDASLLSNSREKKVPALQTVSKNEKEQEIYIDMSSDDDDNVKQSDILREKRRRSTKRAKKGKIPVCKENNRTVNFNQASSTLIKDQADNGYEKTRSRWMEIYVHDKLESGSELTTSESKQNRHEKVSREVRYNPKNAFSQQKSFSFDVQEPTSPIPIVRKRICSEPTVSRCVAPQRYKERNRRYSRVGYPLEFDRNLFQAELKQHLLEANNVLYSDLPMDEPQENSVAADLASMDKRDKYSGQKSFSYEVNQYFEISSSEKFLETVNGSTNQNKMRDYLDEHEIKDLLVDEPTLLSKASSYVKHWKKYKRVAAYQVGGRRKVFAEQKSFSYDIPKDPRYESYVVNIGEHKGEDNRYLNPASDQKQEPSDTRIQTSSKVRVVQTDKVALDHEEIKKLEEVKKSSVELRDEQTIAEELKETCKRISQNEFLQIESPELPKSKKGIHLSVKLDMCQIKNYNEAGELVTDGVVKWRRRSPTSTNFPPYSSEQEMGRHVKKTEDQKECHSNKEISNITDKNKDNSFSSVAQQPPLSAGIEKKMHFDKSIGKMRGKKSHSLDDTELRTREPSQMNGHELNEMKIYVPSINQQSVAQICPNKENESCSVAPETSENRNDVNSLFVSNTPSRNGSQNSRKKLMFLHSMKAVHDDTPENEKDLQEEFASGLTSHNNGCRRDRRDNFDNPMLQETASSTISNLNDSKDSSAREYLSTLSPKPGELIRNLSPKHQEYLQQHFSFNVGRPTSRQSSGIPNATLVQGHKDLKDTFDSRIDARQSCLYGESRTDRGEFLEYQEGNVKKMGHKPQKLDFPVERKSRKNEPCLHAKVGPRKSTSPRSHCPFAVPEVHAGDNHTSNEIENIPARKKAPNIRLRSVSVDVAESSNLNLDNLQDKKKSSSLTNTAIQTTTTTLQSFMTTDTKYRSTMDVKPEKLQRRSSPEQSVWFLVLHDFKATASSDLDLRAGEKVLVIDSSDPHWWKGRCDEKVGYFPAHYVLKMNPREKAKKIVSNITLNRDTRTGKCPVRLMKDQIVIQEAEEERGVVLIRTAEGLHHIYCPAQFLAEI